MRTIRINEKQLYQLIESAIKNMPQKQLNEGYSDRNPDWCGIEGVYFIWYGEQADPELEYNGLAVNYNDVVDYYWEIYQEDQPKPDDMGDKEYDDNFSRFLNLHADDIVSYIENYGEPMDDEDEYDDEGIEESQLHEKWCGNNVWGDEENLDMNKMYDDFDDEGRGKREKKYGNFKPRQRQSSYKATRRRWN